MSGSPFLTETEGRGTGASGALHRKWERTERARRLWAYVFTLFGASSEEAVQETRGRICGLLPLRGGAVRLAPVTKIEGMKCSIIIYWRET